MLYRIVEIHVQVFSYGTVRVLYCRWQFLLLLVPVLAFFCLLMVFYLPTSRQLRRVDSTSRSPVFSLISETIAGHYRSLFTIAFLKLTSGSAAVNHVKLKLQCTRIGRSTIHAFCAEKRFVAEQARRADENHVFNWASLVSSRLLGFYVDMANCLLVSGASVFTALGRNGAVDSGIAGLSLSYAMQVLVLFS